MAGPIRSLDDLARKGFDLNVLCQRCKRHRTFPIALIRDVFRQRRWSDDWSSAAKRFSCSSCGAKTVELRAFLAPADGALDVLRAVVGQALDRRVDTPAIREALESLTYNRADHAPLHAFWWAAGYGSGYHQGRSQAVQSAMRGVLRMYFLED